MAYKARRDALTAALTAAFAPGELTLTGLHTGLHLLAHLRNAPPDAALHAAARAQGVRLSLLSDYDLTGSGSTAPGTFVLGWRNIEKALHRRKGLLVEGVTPGLLVARQDLRLDLCFVVGQKFQRTVQCVKVQCGQVGQQRSAHRPQCLRQGPGQQVEVLAEKGIPHRAPRRGPVGLRHNGVRVHSGQKTVGFCRRKSLHPAVAAIAGHLHADL